MKLYRPHNHHISNVLSQQIPQVAEIHARCFDRGWSENDFSSLLRGKGVDCYVALLIGKEAQGPKGFLVLRTLADQSEVISIATDPKFRKRGIGQSLMEHAIRRLQSDRIKQLFLEVSESNMAALKLYKSLNFKQVSVRKSYYSNRPTKNGGNKLTKTNALVMQLDLR